MNIITTETIAAIATPPGQGGIGIIRVSGPQAKAIAETITEKTCRPRFAELCSFKNENCDIIDQGLILFFPGPNSFTGEDVVEFQGHGGPIILDQLLQRIISLGARLARPGEFSERAFLNNKIDLTQAEAIADLIAATSEQAAKSAIHSLQGEFSKKIHALVDDVIRLRVYVEAAIDFPDEEIDFLADETVNTQIRSIKSVLNNILKQAKQGALLRDGIQVAIAGKPNAGKSSLLNCLTGQDTAIVSDLPGTTRDILREQITVSGMPIHIIDTAGLRDSHCEVEKEGVRRAEVAIKQADVLVLVVDISQSSLSDELPLWSTELVQTFAQNHKIIVVANKIDLISQSAGVTEYRKNPCVLLSAKSINGFDLFVDELKKLVGFSQNSEGQFIARRRHLTALSNASKHVDLAHQQLSEFSAGECMAEELRLAQQQLSMITGEFRSDDLLGEIFSSFCIGK